MTTAPERIEVWSWAWPEVRPGDDLADLVVASSEETPLLEGDVLIVTSKVVSKSEGAARDGERAGLIAAESVRVVARRGSTVIAETRHGLVLAAAGVDESNVPDGRPLALPADPDDSARRLRAALAARLDVNVAVVVSDTAGRAWREGQTDIAIGCAGLDPLLDLRGEADAAGRVLAVTMPAVADEIAAMGDLVKGKASGRPAAVARGLGRLVLPRGQDGPGAAALVRAADADLFGLGSREAVRAAAVRADEAALRRFPAPVDGDVAPFAGLASARDDVTVDVAATARGWTVVVYVRDDAGAGAAIEVGRVAERAATLAAAHRLRETAAGPPGADIPRLGEAWRAVNSATWVLA
jgi:coenzyme F420-0:L-glutamate ligase / coenzyme F420-1:gamma-L-glutamate ligase